MFSFALTLLSCCTVASGKPLPSCPPISSLFWPLYNKRYFWIPELSFSTNTTVLTLLCKLRVTWHVYCDGIYQFYFMSLFYSTLLCKCQITFLYKEKYKKNSIYHTFLQLPCPLETIIDRHKNWSKHSIFFIFCI